MNLSAPFIDRPVATTLLTIGIALAGAVSFRLLPVSPLPQVDFPTISVQASLPGASPETMAATVATPLERSLGRIAGITEMTSNSALGSTRITVQFDLDRDIDGAARDVQAATNANRPKGAVEDDLRHWQIYANDQAKTAAEYLPLIVAYRNGAAVRLSDVAEVVDSVQDLRNAGSANGKPAVLVIINRQPNANIIETVDRVTTLMPSLRASIPSAVNLDVMMERT